MQVSSSKHSLEVAALQEWLFWISQYTVPLKSCVWRGQNQQCSDWCLMCSQVGVNAGRHEVARG